MTDFHYKKSLGQHFLKDKNIIRKIVDIAAIQPDEPVWEVGPGMGILTEELLTRQANLTCFEIDAELYEILEERFGSRIRLIKQDVLQADWQKYFPKEKIKIVANLPYQITSPFLFEVAQYADHFSRIVVMIQKEVAQRLDAKVSTKDYGILTLKMQYYFDVKYEFTVKPHVFNPPPKVDSAVISLIPRIEKPEIEDEQLFWSLVETAFRNRRKMLRRNLREIVLPEKLAEIETSSGIDLMRRGETLTESEFIKLYRSIAACKRL
ncbi:MAG TPA: 16S rRNA (adenine(1518)-N(6)/adenine(1519)-N(6))-dimethyltransferase RsmA [Candidatus Cloacimonadota bacterium]|nr:16S rRNA (adenine(1518)-N(6)/adenine(1519)-N(6))-dimethyltransferase RsmA [Candidatus Cloacimonadota bacterium]